MLELLASINLYIYFQLKHTRNKQWKALVTSTEPTGVASVKTLVERSQEEAGDDDAAVISLSAGEVTEGSYDPVVIVLD